MKFEISEKQINLNISLFLLLFRKMNSTISFFLLRPLSLQTWICSLMLIITLYAIYRRLPIHQGKAFFLILGLFLTFQINLYESLLTINMYAPVQDSIKFDSLSEFTDAVASKQYRIILPESDKNTLDLENFNFFSSGSKNFVKFGSNLNSIFWFLENFSKSIIEPLSEWLDLAKVNAKIRPTIVPNTDAGMELILNSSRNYAMYFYESSLSYFEEKYCILIKGQA